MSAVEPNNYETLEEELASVTETNQRKSESLFKYIFDNIKNEDPGKINHTIRKFLVDGRTIAATLTTPIQDETFEKFRKIDNPQKRLVLAVYPPKSDQWGASFTFNPGTLELDSMTLFAGSADLSHQIEIPRTDDIKTNLQKQQILNNVLDLFL